MAASSEPTNGELQSQIAALTTYAKTAATTGQEALVIAKRADRKADRLERNVARLLTWLQPLDNGTGERLKWLVESAERGIEADTKRQTVERAADIVFGWIPSSVRRVGAVVVALGALAGVLSSVVIIAGWMVETLHHFHLHPFGL